MFQEHRHQMAFGALSTAVSANGDLFNTQHSAGNQNRPGIKDPALDAMIERQAAMVRDAEGRKKALQDSSGISSTAPTRSSSTACTSTGYAGKYVQDWYLATTSLAEPYVWLWLDM